MASVPPLPRLFASINILRGASIIHLKRLFASNCITSIEKKSSACLLFNIIYRLFRLSTSMFILLVSTFPSSIGKACSLTSISTPFIREAYLLVSICSPSIKEGCLFTSVFFKVSTVYVFRYKPESPFSLNVCVSAMLLD